MLSPESKKVLRPAHTFESNNFIFHPSLKIGAINDPLEKEADNMADRVMRMPEKGLIQRKCKGCEKEEKLHRKPLASFIQKKGDNDCMVAPEIVSNQIKSSQGSGQPLPNDTRSFMENRFGTDFSQVRIHNNSRSNQMNRYINAKAFTYGSDIHFNQGQYIPESYEGKRLLAHELTHTIQQSDTIRPYRSKKAFNFGKSDTVDLIEDSFNIKKDKEKKPWIKLITVDLKSQKKDTNGSNMWVGDAVAHYYNNSVKLPDISFTVAAGSPELGKTDAGTFTVHRIEGDGYNSGSNSGVAGVDYDPKNREGPNKRYSKNLSANMSFAVFYNKGEALHAGPIDSSSHGCVHVDWSTTDLMQQLNYHSVIGLTKVKVNYPKKAGKP